MKRIWKRWLAAMLALGMMMCTVPGVAEAGADDYDRAFERGYVDQAWAAQPRDGQVTSSQFRALLAHMVEALAPDRLDYFDASVTDCDLPLTRELAIYMSWYAAVCVGADDYNIDFDYNLTNGDPQGETDEDINNMFALFPTLLDSREVTVGDMTWTMEGIAATFWNQLHASPVSGLQTVAFDYDAGSMRYLDPFTAEDAVRAVARLWDSSGATAAAAVSEGGISERDAARLVQDAFRAGTGTESGFLAAVIADESDPYLESPATRFWFAILVGNSYNEWFSGAMCDGDWKAFIDQTASGDNNRPEITGSVPSGMVGRYVENDLNGISDDMLGKLTCSASLFEICTDVGGWLSGGFEGAVPYHNATDPFLPLWAVGTLYDRTTGEKVLSDYGDGTFRPLDPMTADEAAEAALRYGHSFEPAPELVRWEDAGTYDRAIIPDALLNRETTLPYNDCAALPAEWHGVMASKMYQLYNLALGTDTDHTVYAYDLDIVRDCGLNFVRLGLSFSRLQGTARPEFGEDGCVNLARLRELDQILAWCMERDIHLQLMAADLPDEYLNAVGGDFFAWIERMGHGPQTDEEIADFAAFWGMLARRYADIPNEYLSFNLMNEPWIETDEDYARQFGPAVEAIRAQSPNRTIVADIHNPGTLTGETMAEMGVALSSHFYEPNRFITTSGWSEEDWTREAVQSVTWPMDGHDVRYYFTNADSGLVLYDTVRSTAQAHGVGFMMGECGILLDGAPGRSIYPEWRYADETMYGYYADLFSALEADGTPWCMGVFNSSGGPVQLLPLYDTEYEKVGCYYLDTRFRDFLRSWAK